MSKIFDRFKNIKTRLFSRILNIDWDLDDVFEEDENKLTDDDYANCRRHGGVANIINCWECYAEFRDDENEPEENEDEDD